MPIYEYLCEECGRVTELMQKVSDRPPSKCPECGSKKIAKLVSRTAFQLKGGGWYADLYASPRKDSGKEAGPEPKAPAKGAEAKGGPASSPGPAAEKSAPAPASPPPAAPASGKPAARSKGSGRGSR